CDRVEEDRPAGLWRHNGDIGDRLHSAYDKHWVAMISLRHSDSPCAGPACRTREEATARMTSYLIGYVVVISRSLSHCSSAKSSASIAELDPENETGGKVEPWP